jgi:hypothetical protein
MHNEKFHQKLLQSKKFRGQPENKFTSKNPESDFMPNHNPTRAIEIEIRPTKPCHKKSK